jgi:Predicted membrane protein
VSNVEILYPVIAGVIWSTNPAIIHRFARRVSPALFTAIRALMAVSFTGLLVALNGGIHLNDYSPTIIFLLLFTGVLGPGIGDIAYTRSIQILGGSLAVVISYTYIFFAQFFSGFIFGEEVTYITVIGGLLAFAGIVIASTNNSPGNPISKSGLIYGFIAALCWA